MKKIAVLMLPYFLILAGTIILYMALMRDIDDEFKIYFIVLSALFLLVGLLFAIMFLFKFEKESKKVEYVSFYEGKHNIIRGNHRKALMDIRSIDREQPMRRERQNEYVNSSSSSSQPSVFDIFK